MTPLSEQLSAVIKKEGPMAFSQFMQQALYAPELGYYSGLQTKFGAAGDFVTAPLLGKLFGQCIASQIAPLLTSMDNGAVLEFGPGNGQLAISILTALDALDSLPQHYYMLELSASLRARQQQALAAAIPQLMSRVIWLDSLPTAAFNGIVLANEVLDAMPVERFVHTGKAVCQLAVGVNECDELVDTLIPASAQLTQVVERLGIAQFPYQSECNLWLPPWLKSLHDCMATGIVLLVDYGFPRREFYHPDRAQGTIMCHYQHKAHANPLLHIGEQDITAHVDFTAVAEAAESSGFDVLAYTSQAAFLLGAGILNLAKSTGQSELERQRLNQEIKTLTQPQEMGELFKVMALGKHMDALPSAFDFHDQLHLL